MRHWLSEGTQSVLARNDWLLLSSRPLSCSRNCTDFFRIYGDEGQVTQTPRYSTPQDPPPPSPQDSNSPVSTTPGWWWEGCGSPAELGDEAGELKGGVPNSVCILLPHQAFAAPWISSQLSCWGHFCLSSHGRAQSPV